MKKTFCRIAGLLLTLCLLSGILSWLTWISYSKDYTSRYEAFNATDRQYDVLFFGNSHMWDGLFPMELWEEYGITSYNLAFSAALMAPLYWIMQLSLDRAAPKVIVLDCYLLSNRSTILLPYLQNAMAAFPFSAKKVRAAFDLCPPGEYDFDDTFSLIWSFSQFHNRWPELTAADICPVLETSYGAYPLVNVEPPGALFKTEEALLLDDSYPNVVYLRRIAELCEERGIRLVLTTLPFPANEEEAMTANGVEALARELGVDYLNLLGSDIVDFETDMFDSISHLNWSGALKVSSWLGHWLRDNCALSDHRTDAAYSVWHEDYQRWRQESDARVGEQRVLSRTLMLLSDPQYASVIRLAPGSPFFADPQAAALLRNLSGGAVLPGFDEAAASGQSYLLLVNRREGIVLESVGSDSLPDTPFGAVRLASERAGLTLGETSCELTDGGDALCFVFTADMESLPACSHAFALTAEGIWERCDY
ncbi:MAG: hypothetical protein J5967_10030 [Oscillospiraceae bacterium]|nr:hypothetical protein [Oscillospiraceae bacterium]